VLNSIDMDAVIVIGEGEKDEAPMLFNGEVVGTGTPPLVDIAVDPIDGTRPLANGFLNSIATVSIAPRDTMFNPGPFVYMDKIAVGPLAKGKIDINAPLKDNLSVIAKSEGKTLKDLTVIMLQRPRHDKLIKEVRQLGARIRLIPDGDVAAALMTCMPETGIDVLLGIGGTPEGVLAACAIRAMGGELQGKLYIRNEEERKLGLKMGYELDKVITMDDLVSSDDVFFAATGITDGELLSGVRYTGQGGETQSLVIRGKTGTVRWINAKHNFEKLNILSEIEY
jgi:fructose-1,6-bisphosphatase II